MHQPPVQYSTVVAPTPPAARPAADRPWSGKESRFIITVPCNYTGQAGRAGSLGARGEARADRVDRETAEHCTTVGPISNTESSLIDQQLPSDFRVSNSWQVTSNTPSHGGRKRQVSACFTLQPHRKAIRVGRISAGSSVHG